MRETSGLEAQRDAVTAAVFRIVASNGVEAASLRNVAEEVDLTLDSVQHYFTSQREQLIFIRDAIQERMEQRLEQRIPAVFPADSAATAAEQRAAMEDLLAQLLPLDEERRREAQVWLAFSVAALTRPNLQPLIHDFYHAVRSGVAGILGEGLHGGLLATGIDICVEAERLTALLAGLAVETILHPEPVNQDLTLKVLRHHLGNLVASSGDV